MAIDYKNVPYHKYMNGVEITETDTQIIISEYDLVEDDTKHHFEAVSINLDKDNEFPILYELFIVKDMEKGIYKYHLDKSYLDGVFMPSYVGFDRLFHTFMEIEVNPSGDKNGFIAPLSKPPVREGETNEPA